MTQPTLSIQGAQIPALGFGTFKLKGENCQQAVEHALAVGYRHIDTAQIYDNEKQVGEAIKASSVPRSDIWLTTKVWYEKARPGEVRQAAEESMRELAVDDVDLLLFHWPNSEVPLAETLGALEKVREDGLARHVGVSNFPTALIKEAMALTSIAANQVEFHPLLDQRALLQLAQDGGHMLTAYSPLAQGAVFSNAVIQEVAQEENVPVSTVALSWLIKKDNVAAIPRSSKKRNIEANFAAASHRLSDAAEAKLDALMGNGRVCNPSFSPKWDEV